MMVLGLVGLWLILRSDALSRWLADLLELAASELTGERVVIGDLELRPLQRTARVDGLVVSRAGDPGRGETIVAAETVEVVVGLREGRPVARRLSIRRPVVRLHLDADGLREFPGLREAEGEGAQEFPWEELWIEDADLALQGPAWDLAVDGISVAPTLDRSVARLTMGPARVRVGELERVVEVPGVIRLGLSPRSLSLPPVALVAEDLHVEARAELLAGEGVDGAVSVRVDPSLMRELTREQFRPLTPVHADVELMAGPGGTRVSGLVYWPELQIEVGVREPFRTLSLGTLHGPVSWDGRSIVFEGLELGWAQGRLLLEGHLDPVTSGIYVAAQAEEISLVEALQSTEVSPTPWVGLRGDAEIHVAGTLQPLRLEGSHLVVIEDLDVHSGPLSDAGSEEILRLSRASAEGTLQITDEAVRVGVKNVRTPRSRATGWARLPLSPEPPIEVRLDFGRLDLRELAPLGDIELAGAGPVQVRLYGPPSDLSLDGHARFDDFVIFGLPLADRIEGDFSSPDLRSLSFPDTKADLGSSRYAGSVGIEFGEDATEVDIAVILGSGRLADFTGIFLELPEVDARAEGELVLVGPTEALNGEVDLRFDDIEIFGESFDRGRAVGWMDGGRFTLETLTAQRREGRESLLVRGTVGAGWRTDLEVVAAGFELRELDTLAEVELDLRGSLALDARVGGTLFEPEPEGRLMLTSTSVGPAALEDSAVAFSTRAGRLDWSGMLGGPGLVAQGFFETEGDQAYGLRATLDGFPLEGLYPEGADGSPVEADLSGRVVLSGHFGETPSPVALRLDEGSLRLAWSGHLLETTKPFSYEQAGESFRVRDLELAGGRTQLAFGGNRSEAGQVLFAGGGTVDLDLLRAVTASVVEAQGVAQVNVSVGGPVGDVEPVIDVDLAGARVRTDWLPEPFEEISARLTLRPENIAIREARGRLGGGTWTLDGSFDSEGWVPTRADLAFTLRDGRVQLLDFLPRATGTARLRLYGPMDDLLLSGDVDIADMTFAQRIDWEEWILAVSGDHLAGAVSAERGDYFSMDIKVEADETIRVRNNVGDMVASASLEVVGDTQRPGLTGEVRVQPGGSAYLKEREFEVVRGELHFVEPYSFDPELDISMQTEIAARDQDYLIETQVMGPYSDWRATTSATPGLPEADINALLLFGMTREELERYGLEGALAVEGADLLASSIASSLGVSDSTGVGGGIFGSDVLAEDLLRIDRIDLVSGIDSRSSNAISSELRLLVEGQLPWWEGSTVAVEQNIFRASDRTLTLERRILQSLFASGFWAQEQEGRYLPIGGAYGLDLGVRWELE